MLIKTIIRLQIGAQSATMGPPLGPTLGQFGVSAMDFVKRFNETSVGYVKGTVLTTIIYVYANRTYDIKIIGPLFSSILKKIYNCNVLNGSLKTFFNSKLAITDYMLLELYYYANKYIFNHEIKSKSFVKSIKGQIKSFGILYYSH